MMTGHHNHHDHHEHPDSPINSSMTSSSASHLKARGSLTRLNDTPSQEADQQSQQQQQQQQQQHLAADQHGAPARHTTTKQHKNPILSEEQELALTASDYKNAGNKLCSSYRYDEALQCYAKAIAKNPGVSIFYSNKALCHLKLQQWPEAMQECRKALELDPNLIKAHFFLGQTLAELGQHDEALKHMQRAHELAREKQLNFGDDIAYQIRLTKRRRWIKIENDNAQLEDELHQYLVSLIQKDGESKLKELRERLQTIRGEGSSSQPVSERRPMEGDEALSEEARVNELQETVKTKCDIYTDKLETMFNNLKLQRGKREVPDYLCGKISFEIMRDPVITPSGITYDRQDIEEHLRRVGHFDPITRQPLTSGELVSNLAMKEVVDAYLAENEWANYY